MIVTREQMADAYENMRQGIGVFGYSKEMLALCASLHDEAGRGFAHRGKLFEARACDQVIEKIISFDLLTH